MNVAVRGGDDIETAIGVAGATRVEEDGDRAVDAVVAIGDDAIRSAAANPPEAPLLPVTPDGGRHLVARESLDAALAALTAGEGRVESHPVLDVWRDGATVTRALRDVALVTTAPASISEYAVTAGESPMGSIRADGIVVAAPLGSDGYAAAAGGAVLESGTGVSVVPISPFSTAPEVRVLDPGVGITLSVEREGDVALFADGVRHGSVTVDADLRIDRAGTLDVLAPDGNGKLLMS
ncbi:MAG: ATP-NAD kinase [Haloplanus sp.]